MKIFLLIFLISPALCRDVDGDGSSDTSEEVLTCEEFGDKLDDCVESEMATHEDNFWDVLSPLRIPKNEIQQYCENVQKFRQCAHDEGLTEAAIEQRIEEDCEGLEDKIMLLYASEYVCKGDGRETLEVKFDCLHENIGVDKSNAVELCMDAAVEEVLGHTSDEDDQENESLETGEGLKGNKRCLVYEYAAECLAGKALSYCGSEARDLIRGMANDLEPKLRLAWRCDDGAGNAMVSVVAVALAVIVALLW